MAASEIEKLERRYAENPQGLTFAPLAEVHRKGGDIPRALELLRAGLELHPNYIPASIVLGRCHWDLGDLPAAESAFAHVLRLDDENVIALKSLADINERLERFAEAQRWLQRLVSVDRSNEEARQQLARLEAVKTQGDRKVTTPAPSAGMDEPHEVAAVEARPTEPEPTVIEKQPSSPALEFLDVSEPPGETPGEKPASPAAEQSEPVPGLISQEFVPPKENAYRLHPELTQEFVSSREPPDRVDVETPEEFELRSSGAAEFRVPNAAEEFMDLAAARPNPAAPDPPLVPPTPGPAIEVPEARAPEVPEARAPTPAPPVEPAAQPEPRVADRKESVPPRPEVHPNLGGLKLVTDAEAEPAGRSHVASDNKGQSVADFFRALLAARPPGNPAGAAPAESAAPTLVGQDARSPGPASSKDAAVSFDDFFGSPAGGASSPAQGSGDPSNDDLDQFQSWLQNLKR